MPTNDDEDLFITGHLHQTLAELDEDLEGNSHQHNLIQTQALNHQDPISEDVG